MRTALATPAAAAVLVLAAAPAAAAPPTHWADHTSSVAVEAYAWEQVDACTFHAGSLTVTRDNRTQTPYASLYLAVVDTCAGTEQEFTGVAEADVLQLHGLNRAHVVATVTATEWGGETMTVAVDLTLTGTGEVVRTSGSYVDVSHDPRLSLLLNSRTSSYRDATVTGTPGWFDTGRLSRAAFGVTYVDVP